VNHAVRTADPTSKDMETVMRFRWFPLILLISAACGRAQTASTNPSELMKPKGEMEAYGKEEYRLVNERDEIVSVLRNGLTVITKRVSSPVTSVRGYVQTGGVYEGKWLGGGLSHLLEHLVAGGSSQRRTEAQNRNL